jgi:hypothetical protein
MNKADASTAVKIFMGLSFFLAAGLKITSLPLASHRHEHGKAVAASLVT